MKQLRSLVQAQLAGDRRSTRLRPELLARKWARMAQSPFAFLRGAVPLFEALEGPGGPVGDLHLENFGTFATARGVALHVNDFDSAGQGPASNDVLRLLTSVLLSRSQLRVSGTAALDLADSALEGHQRSTPTQAPPAVKSLRSELATARQRAWLDKRLERPGRFRRDGEKLLDAPPALVDAVPMALRRWSTTLAPWEQPLGAGLEVMDVVRRVAGTGSLGVERLLALTHDAAGRVRLIELKQMRQAADQVVQVMRRCLPRPPLLLGYAQLGNSSMLVRRLLPGEGKLEVGSLEATALPAVMRHLGSLAGEVHRRAGPKTRSRFSPGERSRLLVRARELAGLHEEAFLLFCAAVREHR